MLIDAKSDLALRKFNRTIVLVGVGLTINNLALVLVALRFG
mgnify:CR=1 FL=1|jgi:hypothetical protein|tara:strand:- start:12758 stop:12880 length:123 start_codon:yes stop_codon:yes gene_type:complete